MKLTLSIGALIIVSLLGIFYFNLFEERSNSPVDEQGRSIEIREIMAIVQRVEGDTVIAHGQYVDPTGVIIESGEDVIFRIKITPETKISKEIWYMPTDDELEALGGMITVDQVTREVVVGSVDDFSKNDAVGFPLSVIMDYDIGNDKDIIASEIKYLETIYPDQL